MARKARQKISYVLPSADSTGNAAGHRLGVNGLAVDSRNSILYSGGRDGVLCAWDLHLDLDNATTPEHDAKPSASPASTLRTRSQAHSNWVSDIALVQSNEALVSASQDLSVKLWRPAAADGMGPQKLGLHNDYVKRIATPSATSNWVASGSFDRTIKLWDLSGAGQIMNIDIGDDDGRDKASVYALEANETMLASGGPAHTVKVWDARTGKRTTKLVGHTDLIKDLLISRDGKTIMSASSDKSVKVWSTVAGRCMYTLTMHDHSVWSLFSADPNLSVFHSADRGGLVAKTDTRNTSEVDQGLSVAVSQEHDMVFKMIAAGGYVWTATQKPTITRWRDVNTDNAEMDVPESYHTHRQSVVTQRSRYSTPAPPRESSQSTSRTTTTGPKRKIPLKHVLRLSNAAHFPTPAADERDSFGLRRGTLDHSASEAEPTPPVRSAPDHSIEGYAGLRRGVMLMDRRRALTVDTDGEVVMWDLLKCVPIRSLGKCDLDKAKEEAEAGTAIGTASWCSLETTTGQLAVVLNGNSCFDAEVYADELGMGEMDFREDQRINMGKWVLRYLFANLIDEEIRRDEMFRRRLLGGSGDQGLDRHNAPFSIRLPPSKMNGWNLEASTPESVTTIRQGTSGTAYIPPTPGFNISFAEPAENTAAPNAPSSTSGESAPSEAAESLSKRQSADSNSDYFSASRVSYAEPRTPGGASQPASTPSEGHEPQTPASEGAPKEPATPGKEGFFGKKIRMNMPNMSFGGIKKLGRNQANDKPQAADEKEPDEDDAPAGQTGDNRVVEDNLGGLVQKMRYAYEDSKQHQLASQQARENGMPVAEIPRIQLPSAITPSLPAETPVLKPPANTTILIQEDRPEAGGASDLFIGTVGALGEMCDAVEKAAPMWLGEILLRNLLPAKEVVKVSFILESFEDELPIVSSEGNSRLNANRMLRARKILAYIAERVEEAPVRKASGEGEEAEMKPEEYLELWCQNTLIPPKMTLATIRSQVWRGNGNDVILHYRANGKKKIVVKQGTSGYPPPKAGSTGEGYAPDARPGVSQGGS